MRRVDPYRTEIYTAEQIDEMLSHIAPSESYSKSEIDVMVSDINDDIDTKQDILTAGSNVEISEQNVISATDTKYTAGTGISIDANNVISATGGSGGTWTLRTANNDWSDLFDAEETIYLRSKKEIYIEINNSGDVTNIYIPKGLKIREIVAPRQKILKNYDGKLRTAFYYWFDVTKITNANWGSADYMVEFTISNSVLDFTITENRNGNYPKANMLVYTKD